MHATTVWLFQIKSQDVDSRIKDSVYDLQDNDQTAKLLLETRNSRVIPEEHDWKW